MVGASLSLCSKLESSMFIVKFIREEKKFIIGFGMSRKKKDIMDSR